MDRLEEAIAAFVKAREDARVAAEEEGDELPRVMTFEPARDEDDAS